MADSALRTLVRHADQLRTQARRLLRLKRPANRRLGARLLAASPDAGLLDLAAELLDDADATVRTAAAYALAFGPDGRAAEGLVDRLASMLDDLEPVVGPDLTTAQSLLSPASARPARCMADVAYRLVVERPVLTTGASDRDGGRGNP